MIQDNDDGLAEEKVPVKPSKAAFVMPTQPTADVHEQTVNTKGKKLYKGFKFSIQLQYTPKSGGTGPIPPPVDCDPYDPVIINHGD